MGNLLDPASEGKSKGKRDWSMPNYLAQYRLLAGGDLRAAVLLYRIAQVWFGMTKSGKMLRRFGRNWIAMSRAEWARSSGLKTSEIKNYAIPLLKKHCSEFLEFRPMRVRHDGPNLLWVSVDEERMRECFAYLDEGAWAHGVENYHDPAEQQKGVGYEPGVDDEDSNVIQGQFGKVSTSE